MTASPSRSRRERRRPPRSTGRARDPRRPLRPTARERDVRRPALWLLLLSFVLVAATFGAAVGNGFVYQRDLDPLAYRPLTLATFAIQYAIFGDGAWHLHAFDLLVHATAAWLGGVLLLLRRKAPTVSGGSDPGVLAGTAVPLGAIAAVIFLALHPLRSEAVLHLAGRGELLGASFALLALVHQRAAGPGRRLVPLWLLLALLSSPFALLVLPLVAWLEAPPSRRRRLFECGVALAIAAGIVAASASGSGWPAPGPSENVLVGLGWGERLLGGAILFWRYQLLHLWPVPLSPDYSFAVFRPPSASDPFAWIALAGIVVLAAGVFRLLRVRDPEAGPRPTWQLGLLWSVLGFLLVANPVVLSESALAEKYAYVAGVGWMLALGSVLQRAFDRTVARAAGGLEPARPEAGRYLTAARALAVAALLAVAVAAGVAGALRTSDWRSDRVLFERAARERPESFRVWYELGKARLGDEARAEAEQAFRRAAEIYDRHAPTWEALTRYYFEEAVYDSAGSAAVRLRELDPGNLEAFVALAEAHVSQGSLDEALSEAEAGLAIHPESTRLHEIAGRIHRRQGRPDEAIAAYREAVRLSSRWSRPQEALGMLLMESGHWAEAADLYRRLESFDPSAESANGLAWSLLEWARSRPAGGDSLDPAQRRRALEEAAEVAQRAIDRARGEHRKHPEDTLAQILWELDRKEEAILMLQRIVRNYSGTEMYRRRLESYLAEHPLE